MKRRLRSLTDQPRTQRSSLNNTGKNFLREAKIWYNRDRSNLVPGEEFENTIVLSDEFYAEVLAHPIPVDIDVVKIFGSAPGALDLFVWLAYRCFIAKGEEHIPVWSKYSKCLRIRICEDEQSA